MNGRVEAGVLHLSESVVPEISSATEMSLALRESLAAARSLVAGRDTAAGASLERALAGFESHLAESRSATTRGRARAHPWDSDVAGADERLAWLADLSSEFGDYQQQVERLVALAGPEPEAARALFADAVEPAVRHTLLPLLAKYHGSARLTLGTEAEA